MLNWLIYLIWWYWIDLYIYYIWFSLFIASCFDSILLIWRHTSWQITIVPTPEFKVILRGWFPPPSYSDQPMGMGRPHRFTISQRNPGVVVHHHRILPKESDVSSPIQRVNAMFNSKIQLSNEHFKTLTWHEPLNPAWFSFQDPCR